MMHVTEREATQTIDVGVACVMVDHLFRSRAGQMVAYLTRLLGPEHLDLAEEVTQEALLKALQHWPYSGIPRNPAGWLFRVARNAALDTVRHRTLAGEKSTELAAEHFRNADASSPNVSQRGRVATKRSSSRRRRRVKIRKLSCGPSSAVLLAVLAPRVPICGQWKDTPFPDWLYSATGLATSSLSAAQSCNLQLPVHLAE